jgi:hypothetical protein
MRPGTGRTSVAMNKHSCIGVRDNAVLATRAKNMIAVDNGNTSFFAHTFTSAENFPQAFAVTARCLIVIKRDLPAVVVHGRTEGNNLSACSRLVTMTYDRDSHGCSAIGM